MLSQLEGLFNSLKKRGRIVAPVEKEGFYVYNWVKDFSEVDLNFKLPIFPPKEVFLPQRELLYEFKGYRIKAPKVTEKTVLFMVRPCDVRGIAIMDRFMLSNTVDTYYKKRRENTIIVAHQCTKPEKNCLCMGFGSFQLVDGFDIALTPGKGGYYVSSGSARGKKMLRELGIKEDRNIPKVEFKLSRKQQEFQKRIKQLENYRNSKHWDKAAKDCFSCGGCTLVCPTCTCFDIDEFSEPDLVSGKRLRTWDSCQLEPFTRVAGNHVFRNTRTKRFMHRYYHKLHWGDYCVGCGRCITVCPTKIDMVEVVLKL